MASVGAVPDHSSNEQIEKKGIEELKTFEQESIPLSSENKVLGGEAEEPASVRVLTESEQEVANTQIVPPVITDAEKVDKFDKAPDADVPVADDPLVGVIPDSILDISSVPGSVVEAVEKKPEESPNVTSIEALEKPVEHLEESPPRDSESELGKEPEEDSVVEPKMVEKPESVVEVKSKQQEQSEQFEEKSQMLEPKEIVDRDITIDGGTEVDESLKEGISALEPKMVEKSESPDEEVVGKPQEVGEVKEKSEMLEPTESIDTDGGKDGETQVDESLKEEVSIVEPKTLEKTELVDDMGGKPQEEAGEVEKKSEMLEPKESIDNDSGKDGETQADESLKEEISVVEPQTLEKSEPADEMGGKPQEHGEVEKSEILEPQESKDSDVTKDEATPIDMVKKYTEPLKEEEVTKDQDLVASEADTVVCATQEAESDLNEGGIRSLTMDVVENVSVDDTDKEAVVDGEKAAVQVGDCEANKEEKVMNTEESKDKDVKIEELTQPERTETIDEKEAMDMKIDENEENNVRKEELMLSKPTETKEVSGSYTATEVAESEEQSASKDAEMVIEEKKEQNARVDTPDLNGKEDVVDTNVINEPTAESKESELEGKVEEAIQSRVDNVDKREVTEETAESGAPNVELSKIEDDSKTDQEPLKQEVPAKSSQKQSNIMSKVKQSLVKVKKAIIGKSPSSKTISSEAKGDVQVK